MAHEYLPGELVPVPPQSDFYSNVDVIYLPKKLMILSKDKSWAVVVEKVGKTDLKVSFARSRGPPGENPGPGDIEVVTTNVLKDLSGFLNLDLPEEVKSATSLALSNWDKELLKIEVAAALRGVKVVPSNITDKERLTYAMSEVLIRKYGVTRIKFEATRGVFDDLGFRCYDGKYWSPCEDRIEEWIGAELYGPQLMKVNEQFIDDVKVKVNVMNTRIVRGFKPLLSFENCVLDVENFLLTGDLVGSRRQHSQETYAFHHIPHVLDLGTLEEIRKGLEIFIPPERPEEILKILKSLSPRSYELLHDLTYFDGVDPKIHESRIMFVLEMIGRGLVPGYSVNDTIVPSFKNIFVLVGRKDTGKSTFLRKVFGDTILGSGNYELVDIGKLGSRDPDEIEKTLGKLHRKNPLAALHPDLSKKNTVYNWEKIRQVSGGDPVSARRLYRDPFDYRPHWKIYVSTNDPPSIGEEGPGKEALLGRFRVIETKNKGVREKPLPSLDERDINVLILASLYAVRRVYTTGEYSFTGIRDIEDALNRYTYSEYNVIMEMLETGRVRLDPTLEISSSDLYQECISYSNEVREKSTEEDEEEIERLYSLPDQGTFTKRLKKLLTKYRVKTVRRGAYQYFKGIGVPRGVMEWVPHER